MALQKKEIFIPLSGGSNVSSDPRLPAEVISCDNADFSVPGVVRKREPAAVLFGNATSDTATGISIDALAVHDGRVLLLGDSVYENGFRGQIVPSSRSSRISRKTEVSNILHDSGINNFTDIVDFTGTDQNYYMYLDGGTAGVIGKETLSIVSNSYSTGAGSIVKAGDDAYAVSVSGSSYSFKRWEGADFNTVSTVAATKGVGYPFTTLYWNNSRFVTVGINGTTNVVITLHDISTNTELDSVQINAGVGEYITHFAAGTSLCVLKRTNSNTDTQVVGGFFSISGDALSVSTNTLTYPGAYPISAGAFTGGMGGNVYPIYYTIKPTNKNVISYSAGYSSFFGTLEESSILYGLELISSDGIFYKKEGGRWWSSSPSEFDKLSSQLAIYHIEYYTDQLEASEYPSIRYVAPMWFRQQFDYKTTATVRSNALAYSIFNDSVDSSAASHDLVRISVNSAPKVVPRTFGQYLMIPGNPPLIYDGSQCLPMGVPEYPDTIVATNTTNASFDFTNAGGPGDYFYAATFSYRDSLGNLHESAPSPIESVSFTNTNTYVNVTIHPANLCGLFLASEKDAAISPSYNIYRTSRDGTDFFLIKTGDASLTNVDVVFTDTGQFSLSVNGAIDKIFKSRALYTVSGELENTPAKPHYASCVHNDRYCYVDYENRETDILYSKEIQSGIGPEFNDVLLLKVSAQGGPINAIESAFDKIFAAKSSSIHVVVGDPLNNAGAGSGFGGSRIISDAHGVSGQSCIVFANGSIYFINKADGLIYAIGSDEVVRFVGGPVRKYCQNNVYDVAWHNPRMHSVRFGSATGETLSYDYLYNRWTRLNSRYSNVVAAVSGDVGGDYSNNGSVDVVYNGTNVYIQDPSSVYGTKESYNLDITTGWIPLNDILGYGKLYNTTLLLGAPVAGANLQIQTAYDYDPQWVDTTNITVNTNAFDYTEHFDMTGTNFVDQSAKFEIDGSRHKCDAVRFRIRDLDGTSRNNLEIIGMRLSIGVKPGSTRLGDSRSYNS